MQTLFGLHGACDNCWCMFWRAPNQAAYNRQSGAERRQAMQTLIEAGLVPGLLAYADEPRPRPGAPAARLPAGWVSMGPRPGYPRLYRSVASRPLDDEPASDPTIWAVVCFFIGRKFRRQGLSLPLLQAAVDYARRHGARLIEGYPILPASEKVSAPNLYHGLPGLFEQAGFQFVVARQPKRPIYRLRVGE